VVKVVMTAAVNKAVGNGDTNGISQTSKSMAIVGDRLRSKQNKAVKSLHGARKARCQLSERFPRGVTSADAGAAPLVPIDEDL
jgi:hypothetical protein